MSASPGRRRLRLLSLDGGGVRGLSSLFVLRVLMDGLNSKRNERSLPPLKPCDVFDLIGGTSTGGLIAIMLGRLEMDVDQCITEYNELSKRIFGEPRRRFAVGWSGKITAKFSSAKLAEEIRKVTAACPGVSPDDLFNDKQEHKCRVFVCATAKETGSTTRLRSYTVPGELDVNATIVEAALATSAATTLFEPVTIGRREFVDGALGANNPVGEVESEAMNIWGQRNLGASVKCFVSVGTGVAGISPVQESARLFFSETLVRISTETEATATRFLDRWRAEYERNRYFRFSVQQGLQGVALHEWEEFGLIEAATAEYLRHTEQRVRLERCISSLLDPQGPLLRSPRIFSQDHIFVREDVQSFLAQTFNTGGRVMAVLYGLPGVGKTIMARYFANREQSERAILWIPSGSEPEIRSAFSEYSRILTGQDQEPANFVTTVGELLEELFPQNWVLIFDGLDDPSGIQLETYMFPNLPSVKILITSQNANISDRVNASTNHVMQVSPLTEEDAVELLAMTAARPPRDHLTNAPITAVEKAARKRVVRDLGYLPVAISIVGAILRGSFWSPPISCETYLRRCDESREEDLEEASLLTNYPSVWRAFDICFQKIVSDDSPSAKRAAALAFCIASFHDSSNIKDCVTLYRLLAHQELQVRPSGESTNTKVFKELRFLDRDFLRRSFDRLASANLITGNWARSNDDHVPYMEMHSLVRKWLRRTHSAMTNSFLCSKLWLLGFGMYQQLEQTGADTRRYNAFKLELQASIQSNQGSWPVSVVPTHETAAAFVLESVAGLGKSLEYLPASLPEQHDLATYSDALRTAIRDAWDDQVSYVEWTSVLEDFMDQLDEQVEWAVKFDCGRNPDYQLKHFFLETLDSAGCLPIAFDLAAPYQLQLGGQIGLIEDFKSEATHAIGTLLSNCLSLQATIEAAELPDVPGENRDHQLIRSWLEKWADDLSNLVKRGLDQTFDVICSQTRITEAHERGATVAATLSSNFSASFPRNIFFALLRRAIVDTVQDALGESGALEALDLKRHEMRDRCEQAIRRALGDRAEEVFSPQLAIAGPANPILFSILWDLAWSGRFACGLKDWIGSVIMNSISENLQRAVTQQLEDFLIIYCGSNAHYLAEEVKFDSGFRNIFRNWISSGGIDLPDKELDVDGRPDTDVHETFDKVRASALGIARSFYAGDQHALSTEAAVLDGLKDIFECRRALHDHIMWRLSRPGLNDQTGLGPLVAKMFLEECDNELAIVFRVLGYVSTVAYREELDRFQQIERVWRQLEE